MFSHSLLCRPLHPTSIHSLFSFPCSFVYIWNVLHTPSFSHITHQTSRYEEVELLVEGLPHLDFNQLQAGARYEGGFNESHPTVVNLW